MNDCVRMHAACAMPSELYSRHGARATVATVVVFTPSPSLPFRNAKPRTAHPVFFVVYLLLDTLVL